MGDILERILVRRREDVRAAREVVSAAALAERASAKHPSPPLDLYAVVSGTAGQCIAAEFKRASPSKGDIAAPGTDISAHVSAYVDGGAHLLSVLTEPHWFKGSLADMELVRRLVEERAAKNGLPRPAVLRKDFVVDAYQLAEARAWGADTVLLIIAALLEDEVAPLISASRALGMEPLVEVSSVAELGIALTAGASVIGVNNRNLRTFVLDMGTTAAVVAHAAQLPSPAAPARSPVILSLSGIKEAADLTGTVLECATAAAASGVPRSPRLGATLRGFLIGEALMRAADPSAMVRDLVTAGHGADEYLRGKAAEPGVPRPLHEAAAGAKGGSILVKICGVRDPAAALHAARSGADLIGLILVPGSPRFVDDEGARAVTAALRAFREQQDPVQILAAALSPSAAAFKCLAPAEAVSRLVEGVAALRAAAKRARPLTVGVFMDQSREAVLAAASGAGVDVVQLHGREDPLDFVGFPLPIIKVLHVPVGSGADAAAPVHDLAAGILAWGSVAAAILLDSTAGAAAASCTTPAGGTGLAFNHAVAIAGIEDALSDAVSADHAGLGPSPASAVAFPVLIAGGLTPENVTAALERLSVRPSGAKCGGVRLFPCAVDVSSGVEVAGAPKGTKDPIRVAEFLAHARAAPLCL